MPLISRALLGLFLLANANSVLRDSVRPLPPMPPPLPAQAQSIIDELEKKLAEERKARQAKEQALQNAAADKLQPLQATFTTQGRLDDAVAVRDKIRQLRGLLLFSEWQTPETKNIGETFRVQLTGASSGQAWGTDRYTADSSLPAAAVHAGILKVGETAVVKVEVVRGQENYQGTTRNGVTSNSYSAWPVAIELHREQ